jgi:SMC interacting uncharacterized protein involved in chromosome segregation
MTAELETLKTQIDSIGDKIKELKGANAEKTEIDNAVKELNEAKKKFADQNNGMGVDGKPYEPPMSKAEKKAKAKAEKASGGEDPQQQVRQTIGQTSNKLSLLHYTTFTY